MLKNVLYKAFLLGGACLALAACSDDDEVMTASVGTDVSVQVCIADVAATRATEAGWRDWNENTVTRLDFFQFGEDGSLKKHLLPLTLPPFDGDGGFEEIEFKDEDLTYSDLANNNDVFYLVANCPQLEDADATVSTLADLQAMMIDQSLNFDDKQESFVMDARTSKDSTSLYELDESSKTMTLKFQLYRAAAKLRLTVQDENGNDILSNCTYQLFNYVATPTSVLAESEAYGEGTGQTMETTPDFQSFSLTNNSKAVFYTYPNDWFDTSYLADDGTFETATIYASDDLIDEEKQTYFMLKAPYGGNTYYYKVPLNFSIADYNDQDGFTAEEIEQLRSYHYRINRNSIYDVTVTIDCAGGSLEDPVTPEFNIRVNDWDEGGNYEISDGDFQ